MTAITDAIAVMDILRGVASTNEELLRVADKCIFYAGSAFQPADPENPTNEEKAQLFLTIVRNEMRHFLQAQAVREQNVINDGTIQTAINTALADF